MAEKRYVTKSPIALGVALLIAAMMGCNGIDSNPSSGTLDNDGIGGASGVGGTTNPGATDAGSTGGVGGADAGSTHEVIELDPTFGVDGISIVNILDGASTSEGARAVAVMPDDRIVVAGTKRLSSFGVSYGFATLVLEDGTVDTSFGTQGDGIVHAIFGDTTEVSAVAVDDGGRIVLGGWSKSFFAGDAGALTLARYLSDGTPDGSFGNDPIFRGITWVSQPVAIETTSIALQSDGGIVATGAPSESESRYCAVKMSSDGTPDEAFGEGGVLLMDPGFSEDVLISRDPEGLPRFIIGGSVGTLGLDGSLDFALVSLAEDGSPDATWAEDGMAVTDFGDGSPGRSEGLSSLAVAPSGRVLAAGWAQLLPNFSEPFVYAYDFLVAAYDESGVLDESFGDGGSVLIDFGSDSEEAVAILHRPNRNLAVVGRSLPRSTERKVAIAHLKSDGTPVEGGYKTVTEMDGAGLTARAAALDHRGRLIVAGRVRYEGGESDIFVARYVFREVE